jgi:tRNA pseudouridine55 synthase
MSRQKSSKQWRRVDGVFLLDKPSGISSNQALQRVRHALLAEKGGHTGALDPLATGMLPLCFGEATKIAGLLLGSAKAYETVAKLGVVTDSADADGQVIERRPVPDISDVELQTALQSLIGKIQQVPPIYSALKQGGEPLYAKARRGEVVDVPARPVEVFDITVIARGADWVRMRVTCGSGTYIRSLVRDLGDHLGCGAHVAELRRLWVAPFEGRPMRSLDEVLAATAADASTGIAWYTIEQALAHYPRITLGDDEEGKVRQGQSLTSRVVDSERFPVVALDFEGRAVALMEPAPLGGLRPTRVFAREPVSGGS